MAQRPYRGTPVVAIVFILLAFIPGQVSAAQEHADLQAQCAVSDYELAVLQANGERLTTDPDRRCMDTACTLASYERALLHAGGQLLVASVDPCAAEESCTLASYKRALLQANGQVLTTNDMPSCDRVR